jgi:hypothetical protein
MLVLLHGSGHDGRLLIDPWRPLVSKERIVLVAPNSVDPSLWQASRHLQTVAAVIWSF